MKTLYKHLEPLNPKSAKLRLQDDIVRGPNSVLHIFGIPNHRIV